MALKDGPAGHYQILVALDESRSSKELALKFKESLSRVTGTLTYLKSCGAVSFQDDSWELTQHGRNYLLRLACEEVLHTHPDYQFQIIEDHPDLDNLSQIFSGKENGF